MHCASKRSHIDLHEELADARVWPVRIIDLLKTRLRFSNPRFECFGCCGLIHIFSIAVLRGARNRDRRDDNERKQAGGEHGRCSDVFRGTDLIMKLRMKAIQGFLERCVLEFGPEDKRIRQREEQDLGLRERPYQPTEHEIQRRSIDLEAEIPVAFECGTKSFKGIAEAFPLR